MPRRWWPPLACSHCRERCGLGGLAHSARWSTSPPWGNHSASHWMMGLGRRRQLSYPQQRPHHSAPGSLLALPSPRSPHGAVAVQPLSLTQCLQPLPGLPRRSLAALYPLPQLPPASCPTLAPRPQFSQMLQSSQQAPLCLVRCPLRQPCGPIQQSHLCLLSCLWWPRILAVGVGVAEVLLLLEPSVRWPLLCRGHALGSLLMWQSSWPRWWPRFQLCPTRFASCAMRPRSFGGSWRRPGGLPSPSLTSTSPTRCPLPHVP